MSDSLCSVTWGLYVGACMYMLAELGMIGRKVVVGLGRKVVVGAVNECGPPATCESGVWV